MASFRLILSLHLSQYILGFTGTYARFLGVNSGAKKKRYSLLSAQCEQSKFGSYRLGNNDTNWGSMPIK